MKLVEIARELTRRGHFVRLIAPAACPLLLRATELSLPVLAVSPWLKYLDVAAADRLRGVFHRDRTQMVLIGQSRDVSTVRLATLFRSSPSLLFLQQMQFDVGKKDPFHRWAYGGIDLWLTLTDRMRDSVIRNTTVDPERVQTFPIGSDLTRFDPDQYDAKRERERMNLPHDVPIAAVIGRLDPQKGQDDFVRAASEVIQQVPNAHFVIVGEETKSEKGFTAHLQKLVEELQLEKKVRFLPYTDEVPRMLSAIDLLVLPSHSETFGYILVEAMAMGKPVVATNAGGVPEIVEDGKSGLLCAPRDARAMAGHIVDLLRNPDLYSRIAFEARRRATKHFDFRSQMTRLEEILCSLRKSL